MVLSEGLTLLHLAHLYRPEASPFHDGESRITLAVVVRAN